MNITKDLQKAAKKTIIDPIFEELFEQSYNVKIEPLPFDTDGRRDIPRMKPFRRADYNVFVVGDQEMFMGTLKGYCHNSGHWDDDYEEE
jgi:hypothetical protein